MTEDSCAKTPRCGIHKLRIPIVDLAFWDVLMTLIAAFAISRFVPRVHLATWILILFVLGIVVHAMLGIQTRLNCFLLR